MPIPILTYHQIDQAPPKGAPMRSLYVSPSSFARQMATLHALGYQGLSMSALMPYLRGELTGKVVGITFDDGYQNNLTNALPVLRKFGFSSTCYVVSGLTGQTNVWDAPLGIASAPLMTESELTDWVKGGQEVGAHTQHHVDLLSVDPSTAKNEIHACRTQLEFVVKHPVTQFCYPYGRFDATHVAMVQAAGYDAATTTHRGRVHLSDGVFTLARIPVVRSTYLPQFLLKVLTAYEDKNRA